MLYVCKFTNIKITNDTVKILFVSVNTNPKFLLEGPHIQGVPQNSFIKRFIIYVLEYALFK